MRRTSLSRRVFLARAGALSTYPFLQAGLLGSAAGAASLVHLRSAHANDGLTLVNPRLAHPVFAEPGGTFAVEVATDRRLDASGWTVQLRTDQGAAWACRLVGTETEGIDYGRQTGYRLIVQLPASITPELLTLEVRHRDVDGSLREERAVSVVPSLWSDCYLLQLTDEHVMYDSATHYANDDPRSGYRSADLVRWATPVVNLINPRLVINSGDEVHQYATTGWRYTYSSDLHRCYLNAKRGYRVPSLMILGNHEIDEQRADRRAEDWAHWERIAGRRCFHIRMGSLKLFAHDYFDPQSRSFVDQLYRESFRDDRVEGRIFVQHHLSMYGIRPSAEYAPTAMLIGHIHNHQIVDRWPYPILMGGAAHKYARGGLLRLARHDGRWTTDAGETWMASAVSLVGDYGVPRVAARYAQPNDGRARANTVTITNKLAQRFGDGRVRLVLAEGRYSVRGGDILSRYPLADGKTAVLVRVDIPAQDTLTLEVVAQTSSSAVPGGVPDERAALDTLPGEAVPLDATGATLWETAAPPDSSDGALAPPDPGATVDPPDTQRYQVALPMVQ